MNPQHTTNPALEALELADVAARNSPALSEVEGDPTCGNQQDADAFPDRDEMSERDADAAFVAEMTRRDVQAGTDGDKPRPGGAALHPDYPHFVEFVKAWPDRLLIEGISLADEGALKFTGDAATVAAKCEAWLDAASAELIRRMDVQPQAA